MTFREIQQGYVVYLFDRQAVESKECKVLSVSAPRFENKSGIVPQMVLDLTIDNGGEKTYVVPENTGKAYAGGTAIATDKESVIAEIKAMKTASESILADVQKHKEVVSKCGRLLESLDTAYKEKKENEERLTGIEDNLQKLSDMVASLLKKGGNGAFSK